MSIKIKSHKANLNKGTKRGKELVEKSIQKFGMRDAVIIDKKGEIISGNHRHKEASKQGIKNQRIIEASKDEIIAIQYNDIDLDSPEGKELALALNQTAAKNISIDVETAIEEIGFDVVQSYDLVEVQAFTPRQESNSYDSDAYDEDIEDDEGIEKSKETKKDDYEGRFPLSIVLTMKDYKEWQEYKKSLVGRTSDTDAFLELFKNRQV